MPHRKLQKLTSSSDPSVAGLDETPEWVSEAKSILQHEYIAAEVERNEGFLSDVALDQLQPHLSPVDRVMAEMIIERDRLKGICHPEMAHKLTAHW